MFSPASESRKPNPDEPSVSPIVPCFNYGRFLPEDSKRRPGKYCWRCRERHWGCDRAIGASQVT